MGAAYVATSPLPATTPAATQRAAPQTYATPRPDHARELVALSTWPKKIVTDDYKLMRPKISAEHLMLQEANEFEHNFPKAANRFGVAFLT